METDMRSPAMLSVLVDALKERKASPNDVLMFQKRWRSLRGNDAFPCPICFLKGSEQPLAPMNEVGGNEPVVCPSCRAVFDVPIPS
jgi:hypothetical protein